MFIEYCNRIDNVQLIISCTILMILLEELSIKTELGSSRWPWGRVWSSYYSCGLDLIRGKVLVHIMIEVL